jgi:hypothetical protein
MAQVVEVEAPDVQHLYPTLAAMVDFMEEAVAAVVAVPVDRALLCLPTLWQMLLQVQPEICF